MSRFQQVFLPFILLASLPHSFGILLCRFFYFFSLIPCTHNAANDNPLDFDSPPSAASSHTSQAESSRAFNFLASRLALLLQPQLRLLSWLEFDISVPEVNCANKGSHIWMKLMCLTLITKRKWRARRNSGAWGFFSVITLALIDGSRRNGFFVFAENQ